MRVRPQLTGAVIAIVALASCRGLLGIDDPVVGDGGGGSSHDGPVTHTCLIPAAFTHPTLGVPQAKHLGSGVSEVIAFGGTLDNDFAPDVFSVDLHAGRGVFPLGLSAPLTIALSGPELGSATCGACVYLGADYGLTGSGPAPTQIYWARSGTLHLETLEPTLAGQVTNVTYQHVDADGNLDADGCVTTIDTVTFSVSVGSG
jgi:hypothetical protein